MVANAKVTEAQKTYDRIEELKAGGISNAEAIKKVAEESGKSENTVRANQYQHRKKLDGGGGSRRTRRISPENAVSQARELLTKALQAIDADVAKAEVDLKAAQERYDNAVASVADRKLELQRKIDALSG
jgi:uncharacterized protein YoaH (UPF0181 family)